MSYDIIHESELFKSILDGVIDGANSLSGTIIPGNRKNITSITRNSKDFVLTFPVFVPAKTMDPKLLHKLTKALETKYASLLVILFNAMSDMSDESIRQFIRKFHINMGSEVFTSEQFMEIHEAVSDFIKIHDKKYRFDTINRKKNIMKDLKENTYHTLPHSLSEHGIDGKIDFIDEAKNRPSKNSKNTITLDNGMKVSGDTSKLQKESKSTNKSMSTDAIDKSNKDKSKSKNNDTHIPDKDEQTISTTYRYKGASLSNSEVKKNNDLEPTLIKVSYYATKTAEVQRDLFLGVKTRVYVIDSDTLVSKIVNARTNRGILNLVRATTREISFVKDFLLSIDTLKKDAKNAARNKNSIKEWKKLENRSTLVKINHLTGINLAQAISTLVITKSEAYRLADDGIDIFNPTVVKAIINKYSLLGFVIVDEEFELVHMMFDGDDNITQIHNKALGKEKNGISDLVTLLGKSM